MARPPLASEIRIEESWYRRYGSGYACDASQRTLLVLVHGYGGDPHKTFSREAIGGLAEWVLDTADLDADVLSFGFETNPWRRADIVVAASDLGRLLRHSELRGRCYGHLVFITHSTGGLVLKCLLNDDLAGCLPDPRDGWWAWAKGLFRRGPRQQPDRGTPGVPPITSRTRAVVNFAVPHAGASPFVSVGLFGLGILNALYSGAVWLRAAVRGGEPTRGFNAMVWQLQFHNPWVVGRERDHVRLLGLARDALLPRPVMVDILADSDPVIARYRRGGDAGLRQVGGGVGPWLLEHYTAYTTRGTHSLIKLPEKPTDLVVSEVAGLVKHVRARPGLTLSAVTFARIADLDKREDLGVLFDDVDRSGGTAGSSAGSQADVYGQLAEHVPRPAAGDRDRPQWFVVIGDAGVGKTVALRRLARRFAADYPAVPDRVPLPLLIPLQQISVGDLRGLEPVRPPDRPDGTPGHPPDGPARIAIDSLWAALLDYWCRWMTDELIPRYLECSSCPYPDPAIRPTPAWVEEQLRSRPSVLILDAVDEFLMVDRRFLVSDIRELLDHLRGRYHNPSLSVVLGVRKSQPNLAVLTDGAKRSLEILPISEKRAGEMFRGAAELLSRLPPEVKKLLLTPLVLTQLGPRMKDLDDARLLTRAGILRAALEEILRKSFDRERGYQSGPWVDALTVTGWLFFRDDRGQLGVQNLSDGAEALREEWAQPARGVAAEAAWSAVTEATAFLRGPRQPDLLDRTVFLPTGRAAYRFRHREWTDFLVGLYVAQCTRAKHFTDFGTRIFNKDVYLIAGEEMDRDDPRVAIEAADVEAVDATTDPARRVCALSNLLATMGNSHIDINRSMTRVGNLLRSPHTPVLPAILGINTFCVRLLRRRPDDTSRESLLRELAGPKGVLETIHLGGTAAGWNGVLVSQAWCFLHALSRHAAGQVAAPAEPWPGFGPPEHALEFIRPPAGDKSEFSELLYRSLRMAWAAHSHASYGRPHEAIPILHYLYPMVVGLAGGQVCESDAIALIRRALEPDSPVRVAIDQYKGMPDPGLLFAAVEVARPQD